MRDPDVPVEEWQRPVADQIATVRHGLAGVKQQFALLHEVVERQGVRIETMDKRQTVMEASIQALSITPDAMALVVESVLDRRAEENSEQRKRELREVFTKTRAAALYIIAIGQALMMLAALWFFVLSNLF